MPFPQSVREQALVAAARYCCVCHRYKGVKVEVHHIVPEAEGGTNDTENAIALCFDCHADAGHYNPNHPRGTKFSPDELRRHRDGWHAMVRRHAIQPADERAVLYCRYLLCKSFEAFREIALGDLSRVPAPEPFLVTNDVREFHRYIVDRHPAPYRHGKEWGEEFESHEAYSKTHPSIRVVERSSINLYPYFEAVRTPSLEELRERVAPRDVVTRVLLEAGVPLGEISIALAYNEVCGSGRFQEIYRLRPLWALYLAVTNLEATPVALHTVVGIREASIGLGYRPFFERFAERIDEQRLPAAPLPPGATMLMPLGTLLGPLGSVVARTMSELSKDIQTGQVQRVAHQDLTVAYENTAVIGPAFWPRSLRLAHGGAAVEQSIHEFDLSNLYTMDRSWEAGSCPHLFSYGCDGRSLRYLGELFARQPGSSMTERLVIPQGTAALLIAELETEQTTIEEIRINGQIHLSHLSLQKGDMVRLPGRPGDVIELSGYYTAGLTALPDPWVRNCLIHEFMLRGT